MTRVCILPIVAILALASPSFAQAPDNSAPTKLNTGTPTAQDQNVPGQQRPSTTTASPQEKSGNTPTGNSATGWSGGDQEKAGDAAPKDADPSTYASGADLKGPPQTYAPTTKTPE